MISLTKINDDLDVSTNDVQTFENLDKSLLRRNSSTCLRNRQNVAIKSYQHHNSHESIQKEDEEGHQSPNKTGLTYIKEINQEYFNTDNSQFCDSVLVTNKYNNNNNQYNGVNTAGYFDNNKTSQDSE